jgi:hypothetical protein
VYPIDDRPPAPALPCDECGELTPRLELVPRREGPEPWEPTRWICADCDDDAAQQAAGQEPGDEDLDSALDEEG